VAYIQKLNESWDLTSVEEVDILPIIYQIFKFGIPLSIKEDMFSELKQHFEGRDDVLGFMYEMNEIMEFRADCDPDEPTPKYTEFFDIDRHQTYDDWMRKWVWSLDGLKASFNVKMMKVFTESILKSLTNVQ
jgi:hypothetical protein